MFTIPRLLRQSPAIRSSSKFNISCQRIAIRGAQCRLLQTDSQHGTSRRFESLFDEIQRAQKSKKSINGTKPLATVDVVSDQLCDDALKLLAPSVEGYKGCDVLDLFPGNGLWSRKINEYLKPRTHILVDIEGVDSESLLDKIAHGSPSSFKLQHVTSTTKGALRRLANDVVSKHIVSKNSEEKPLLILAGLTQIPITKQGSDGKIYHRKMTVRLDEDVPVKISISEPFMLGLIRQVCAHDGKPIRDFRLLAWMLDGDKNNYLPRDMARRRATAFEMADVFRINEIVGCSNLVPGRSNFHRSAKSELRNALQVLQRMTDAGITVPKERLSPVLQNILNYTGVGSESQHANQTYSTLLEQDLSRLDQLEMFLATQNLTGEDSLEAKRIADELTLEMAELIATFDKMIGASRAVSKSHSIVLNDRYVHEILLIELERSIAFKRSGSPFIVPSPTAPGGFVARVGPEPLKTDQDIDLDLPSLMSLVKKAKDDRRYQRLLHEPANYVDNHFAMFRPDPILQHDSRWFEPLQPRPEEFYPRVNLALLDFQPRPLASPIPGASPNIPLSRLPPLRRLMRVLRTKGIPEALDRLAHGASEAILPDCPSVSDPTKGGRFDPHMLRARMLTREMWVEVMTAWYGWPFKRSDEDIDSDVSHDSDFFD